VEIIRCNLLLSFSAFSIQILRASSPRSPVRVIGRKSRRRPGCVGCYLQAVLNAHTGARKLHIGNFRVFEGDIFTLPAAML